MNASPEPPDHHVYNWVTFNRDTFEFYRAAVLHYESLLRRDLDAVATDEDLRTILGTAALESYPIAKELKRVERVGEWIDEEVKKGGKDAWDYDVHISHGTVRFLKSVGGLYLEHLRNRRQVIASRSSVSKAMLEAVDQQLARFGEKVGLGVFRAASLYPLQAMQVATSPATGDPHSSAETSQVVMPHPRPVVLDTIEIRDPELRKRCLDLLAQFREDGQFERLDTVVNEATRILEDRLRSLSAAPATCVGVDLAKHAFAGPTPRVRVSDIDPEQEAAHLLFRGVFGFVRNSVHHRLVGDLQPERVLQVVGMVDYLISVAEAARREFHDSPKPVV